MGFDKAKAISAAEKYLAQGKIPSAITEYCRIVERDPNDQSALNTLGDLYVRVNKRQDAIECFQRVADHYREQGFTLKAIAIYKKISRLDPSLPAVAQRLAVLYEQQGHFVEAREQYLAIADTFARAGKMRDSLDALRRSADLEPNNVEIRLRLGEGFLREGLGEEAADAFIEAGERLLARDKAQWALESYTKAHNIRPHDPAVLHGLVAAHTKLGAPDEAAAVLEQAVADRPQDVELRAMLSRAYLDAEDATAAERATIGLIELEASNFPQLFEVARLYLQRGDTHAAVGVLARAIEPALAKRQEQKLLGLLNDALARDPEQIEALRLLLRIYTWQRDDDHMRVTLERLAEAAQTHNLVGEERRALEHLVRLVPFDQSYHDRLSELGEAPEGEDDEASATWYEPPVEAEMSAPPAATFDTTDVPVFDDMIERGGGGDVFAAEETPPANASASGGGETVEFEWNSVAMPEAEESKAADAAAAVTIDPSSSFADLNEDLNDMSARSSGARAATFGAVDLNTGSAFEDAALAPEKETGDGRVRMLLAQELESVDYYLAQGYSDIARDTLDMLERQYGANEEITRRRRQLAQADEDSFTMPSVAAEAMTGANSSNPSAEFETFAQFESFAPLEETVEEEVEIGAQLFVAPEEEQATIVDEQPTVFVEAQPTPIIEAKSAAPPSPPPQQQAQQPGLHPELADMFDEFRDEVEAGEPPASTEDYETHYNTALAYREMGLVDQAVEELQAAIALAAPQDGTPRYLQCCNLLGHCFMQKNMPRPAAMWFKKGLDAPGHTEDEYQALRYELGAAYEQMGDLERAIEVFSEVYGTDVNYRGVAARLRDLQTQKT
ncbi:MAG TPA: tetratricopeptide repeat protein [Pyrinomonadaceae bacterium]|jgi:tetratricopeptide (TPR) repeat protein|nr:tetratricopeptide repeat protein [Pyrinomonadaceae bacterium]